jgi:hypothetical protein
MAMTLKTVKVRHISIETHHSKINSDLFCYAARVENQGWALAFVYDG